VAAIPKPHGARVGVASRARGNYFRLMSYRGGIDLGGTKIQAAVVDAGGAVVGQSRLPTPTSGGPRDVADALTSALREAAEQAGVETSALQGIGVGSPGMVDNEAGTVTSAKNLPDWGGSFNLRAALEASSGVPVAIGNDVDVATDAEFQLG